MKMEKKSFLQRRSPGKKNEDTDLQKNNNNFEIEVRRRM